MLKRVQHDERVMCRFHGMRSLPSQGLTGVCSPAQAGVSGRERDGYGTRSLPPQGLTIS
jgi:hypothetical protein